MSSELQNLSSQFNSLLAEYKDIYNKYVDVLNSKDNGFIYASDSQFVGKSNLNVLGGSSVSACESECSKNNSCRGATFNNSSGSCTLGSGPGEIVHTNDSVAIVKKALYYSNILKGINADMTSVNKQMIELSKNNQYTLQQSETQTNEQNVIMINNNNVLLDERVEIEKMTRQFQTIEAAYEDGNIVVNANYSSYIVLLFVVVLLILLLFRFSLYTPQYGGGHREMSASTIMPIVFGILSFIIILNAILRND
jgi:hypothetical protein